MLFYVNKAEKSKSQKNLKKHLTARYKMKYNNKLIGIKADGIVSFHRENVFSA